jgi:hypothetical protein
MNMVLGLDKNRMESLSSGVLRQWKLTALSSGDECVHQLCFLLLVLNSTSKQLEIT